LSICLLDKISRQSVDLIRRVESSEEAFRGNFLQNVRIQHLEHLSMLRQKVEKLFSKVTFDELKEIINNFKIYEYDLLRNKFLPNNEFEHSLSLGRLETHIDFVKWSNHQTLLNLITCNMNSNDIEVLNVNTNSSIKCLKGHTKGILWVTLDGKDKLLSASLDSTIKLWNLNTNECLQTFYGHTKTVNCVKILLGPINKERQFVSCSDDKTLKIWPLTSINSSLSPGVCLFTLHGHTDWINCVDQLSNGRLVSASEDRSVRVWDLNKRLCVQTLLGHQNWILSMRVLREFNDDDIDLFATSSVDKTIKIWNEEKCLQTLRDHTGPVYDLEVLITQTNEKQLISCSFDKTIRIWIFPNFTCVGVINYPVACLRVNKHNGQLICSSYFDKSIRVWDMSKGECVQAIGNDKKIMKLEICAVF
jgi:WD40 repeat protein